MKDFPNLFQTANGVASVSDTSLPPARARRAAKSRLADFVELTKPRLNSLVVITTAVGYYMGVRYAFEWLTFVHALIGTALTAAGASALNQYLERDYDALMPRTANRPLPARRLTPVDALVFGTGLAVLGLLYLLIAVNPLTALLGALTLASYIFVYTPLKRYTTLNTIIGAVPGATPFLMGWTAVRGQIAPEGIALLILLFLWQMPHFLAIAILYRSDYAKAGYKMLPVVDEHLSVTGRQIVLYTLSLIPATLLPAALRMTGMLYMVTAGLLGAVLLSFAISCAATRSRQDARRLFLASVLYLPVLLAMMMVDKA